MSLKSAGTDNVKVDGRKSLEQYFQKNSGVLPSIEWMVIPLVPDWVLYSLKSCIVCT